MDKQYQYWPGVPGIYEGFYWRKVEGGYEYISKSWKKDFSVLNPEEYIWHQTPWR